MYTYEYIYIYTRHTCILYIHIHMQYAHLRSSNSGRPATAEGGIAQLVSQTSAPHPLI